METRAKAEVIGKREREENTSSDQGKHQHLIMCLASPRAAFQGPDWEVPGRTSSPQVRLLSDSQWGSLSTS